MQKKKIIPYGSQWIFPEDIDSLNAVFDTGWITQGPKIRDFEDLISETCGCKYAVAVSSGTAALHIACLAAGLKKGDEAVTTPITFLATPNSVVYTGARPVFADIDLKTVNIDWEEVEKKISKRTKAVLPVDFAGLPCDLSEIHKLAKKHGLMVIEDSCHALGATYKGSKIGDCRFSDMTVFSFHPVKHITTGEGGAITTNSKRLYDKLMALRNHGTYKKKTTLNNKGPWYYEMEELGFNYRITDMQTALGCSQIKRLPGFLKRREYIAERYNTAFSGLGDLVTLPELRYPDRTSAWHLYLFRVNKAKKYLTRRKLFEELHEKGIKVQVHYIPVTRQPFYKKMGYASSRYPNCEAFYESVLSLPLYPRMTDEDIDYVIGGVKEIIKKAVR